MWLTPDMTWTALLIVQTLHLLHHRLAKRHISFVEVLTGVVLLIPITAREMPLLFLMIAHLGLIGVQVVGSIWMDRLSPRCGNERGLPA